MKKSILLLIISFIVCAEYEDVIYLKNGSILYGTIIETPTNSTSGYYKIKSGKNFFVYSVNDIEVIKKEVIDDDPPSQKVDEPIDKGWNKTRVFI